MKRLLPLLISIAGLAASLYFAYIYEIEPKLDTLEIRDYIIYALVIVLPLLIGILIMLVAYSKKDKKIRPSRMHPRKSFCYIFSYTLVRLSISLCTFSSITFFFLEMAL